VAAAVSAALALTVPAAVAEAPNALARPPSPSRVIREAILRHNGGVGAMFVLASQADKNYQDCLEQENQPPPDQD
jgi:hypothetical protein